MINYNKYPSLISLIPSVETRNSGSVNSSNGFIWAEMSGSNRLVPGAPDIDNQLFLSISETVDGFHIDYSVTGNNFPASELVAHDREGNGLILGGRMPRNHNSPYTSLYGKGEGNVLYEGNLHILAQDGVFQGVKLRNGTVLSVDLWNSMFTGTNHGAVSRTTYTPDQLKEADPELYSRLFGG